MQNTKESLIFSSERASGVIPERNTETYTQRLMRVESLKCEDPFRYQDSNAYYDSIRGFNRALLEYVRSIIHDELARVGIGEEYNQTNIFVTGSDARLEKGNKKTFSKIELILLKSKVTDISAILHTLTPLLSKFSPYIDTKWEIKDLNEVDDLLEYTSGAHLPFPGRVLEGYPLVGDFNLLVRAQEKIASHILNGPSREVNKLFYEIRKRAQSAKACALSGEQIFKKQSYKHFNRSEGAAFFDPPNGLRAFKYGPLRAVQETLHASVLFNARQSADDILITTAPANIKERILYLSQFSLIHKNSGDNYDFFNLTKEEIIELINLYELFVHMQHKSEYLYFHQMDQPSRLEFKSDDVPQKLDRLVQLLDTGFALTEDNLTHRGIKVK